MTPSPLEQLMQALRHMRATGPWESQQTHQSLRPYALEESQELVEAIDSGNMADIKAELGDVLLQVLFHSVLAEEHPDESFDLQDIAAASLNKLRHRSPYFFGEGDMPTTVEQQHQIWQHRKSLE